MMSLILRCIGAFLGTVGFSFLLDAPRKTIFPASLIALLSYLIYELMAVGLGQSMIFSYFFATVVITVICEMVARRMHMPTTVFLLSAMVPLAPGYSIYHSMLCLVQNNGAQAASSGLNALQAVGAMAVGAAVTSVCFRSMSRFLSGQ
ncbi:MAG: threonine/serine exporter family protein [Clostridia bacterium]|nr:threonine/serine exporter family protein [Clostridia bacterium]